MALFRCGGETPMYFHSYGQTTGANPYVTLTNVIGNVKFVVLYAVGSGQRAIATGKAGGGVYTRKAGSNEPYLSSSVGFTQTGTTVTLPPGTTISTTYDAYYWSDKQS